MNNASNITVREIINILADAKIVRIGFDGLTSELDFTDQLALIAYGNFIVNRIYASGDDEFELDLVARPVVKS